ncbi:hypothetical protein M0Q28_06425 [Patescibacteria group bacterium]|jgi:hypothetical protein|nr:hypothetical protein [Patescibacteria group bacterium]
MKFESSSAISKGLGNALEIISEVGSLPFIRGTWFYVDPLSGDDNSDGRTIGTALAGVRAAYGKCTDKAGDGICFLSRGSATSSDTTAYLGGTLNWAKHGITFFGACAGQGFNNRARVVSLDRSYAASTLSWTAAGVITDSASGFLTEGFEAGDAVLVAVTSGTAITALNVVASVTASTMTLTDAVTANAAPGASTISNHCRPLINLTGRNNRFVNLAFVNEGTVATDDGAVLVAGVDNYFENCYFNGATSATVAAETTAYHVTVNTSECRFKHCFFGSNSTIWAGANALLRLGVSTTQIGQNFFEDCYFTSYSATAGHMAIAITNAATLGGWIVFKNCSFVNWDSGAATALTAAIGGTDTNNMGIILEKCSMVGWAIWVDTGWDNVYTDVPASASAGGVAVVTG